MKRHRKARILLALTTLTAAAAMTLPSLEDDDEWLDCNGRDFDMDSDCTIYWQCHEGLMKKRACPEGLMWDQTRNICDWPDNIRSRPECHNNNTEYIYSPGSVIGGCQLHPHPITGWICPEPSGLFTDFASENCNSFYICNRCRPDWKHCGPDLGWHRELMTCDWWDVVRPKCRNYPRETPPPTTPPTTTPPITTPEPTTKPKITALYVNWWLTTFDADYKRSLNSLAKLRWAYATNLTEINRERMQEANERHVTWLTERRRKADRIRRALDDLAPEEKAELVEGAERLFDKLVVGHSFNETLNTANDDISAKLGAIFSTAKVPDFRDPQRHLPLRPDISRIMATSRNASELEHYWRGWRDATGPKMKGLFKEAIEVQNLLAQDAGFPSAKESWMSDYEIEDLEATADELFQQVKPLYEQLHAFVRGKLKAFYGDNKVPAAGPIPEYLLGNMQAQDWVGIEDIVSPFESSKEQLQGIEDEMRRQGFSPLRMFLLAEDFFKSLGLEGMTSDFWRESIITRPTDRDIDCHGSAWDFKDGSDYRIKMCAIVNVANLQTVHHEMGHIAYDMAYRRQPALFQDGSNPAFHEALGDAVALSSMSVNHLNQLSLIRPRAADDSGSRWSNGSFLRYIGGGTMDLGEPDLAYLFSKALSVVAFLPFGYLTDKWRWAVFDGSTAPDRYNAAWWELKLRHQGVTPPPRDGLRGNARNAFDPGAKYHVIKSVSYVRYFFAHLLQFQIYEGLCRAARHVGPLHRCDFYGSREAGAALKAMMETGSSRPWQEALEKLTGERKISSRALLEYFEPLRRFLQVENLKSGQRVGWAV